MRAVVFALLAALIGSGKCQTPKEASALCVMDEESDMLRMYFSVATNSEAQGFLYPINYAAYANQDPYVISPQRGCNMAYQNGVWRIQSAVDDNSGKGMDNDCNLTVTNNQGNQQDDYMWTFFHGKNDPMSAENWPLEIEDKVYVVVCTVDGAMSNRLTTSVQVLTPLLEQTPTIVGMDVMLQVLVDTNNDGTYEVASEADAGCNTKIRLVYNWPANANPNFIPYGIYGGYTYVGPNINLLFSPGAKDLLIDRDGCPYDGTATGQVSNNDQKLPFDATEGYMGVLETNGVQYTSTSGAFPLFKYDGSDELTFVVNFGVFHEPAKDDMDDPCEFFRLRRKKRSTEQEVQTTMTVSMKVKGNNGKVNTVLDIDTSSDDEAGTSVAVAMVVGAVVGAAVVMLVAGLICLVSVLFRRQRRSESAEPSRASSTASIVKK